MSCPNCGSSKVRRSRRNVAEKIFLSMLVTRPFRCDDCIARFFSWMWRSPELSGPSADLSSLVYNSPTAALHSSVYRSRRKSRRAAKVVAQRTPLTGVIASWLKKPIKQPAASSTAAVPGTRPRVIADPRPDSLPEILGVILEMKQQLG
jgi:hypothetical protein